MLLLVVVAVAANASAAMASGPGNTKVFRPGQSQISMVGASSATLGNWPSIAQVSVRIDNSSFRSCTATVVSQNLVLTAAHCARDTATATTHAPADLTVTTGRTNRSDSTSGEVHHVSQVIVNPTFDSATRSGDLALLVLATPTSAPPIKLATTTDLASAREGVTGFVAGWGITGPTNTSYPDELQSGAMTIQSNERCAALVTPYDPATTLCAEDLPAHKTGVCSGDSGGPLLARAPDNSLIEIGITVRASPNCDPALPSTFARASAFAGWVNAMIVEVSSLQSTASAADRFARPGSYRGSVNRRFPIRFKIAPGGRNIKSLSFAYRLKCAGSSKRQAAKSVLIAPRGEPSIANIVRGKFSREYAKSNGLQVQIKGRFVARGRISGTIRTRLRTNRYGACDTGILRFVASQG